MEIVQSKKIFYFSIACKNMHWRDSELINKVREYIKKQKPKKIWEGRGLFNSKLRVNVFPDYVILLNNKLIACEVEKSNLAAKFAQYVGIKIFDELWFFTEITLEKRHLHYKFINNFKKKQKFFGLNNRGKIVQIKI